MYKTYEYLAIDVYDKWGQADIETINAELNRLGAEGWHLVTAYANELNKNGVSIDGLNIASTVDQNVFIFEREVIKETPEEIAERKLMEDQKLKLLKEKEEKALEEKIMKFKASKKFVFAEQKEMLDTFKTATEILNYLIKLDLDSDYFKDTIIPEIQKIADVEKFYGNRYDAALEKLKELTE